MIAGFSDSQTDAKVVVSCVPELYVDVIRLFIKPDQRCDGEILFRVYEHLRQKESFWPEQLWFFFGEKDKTGTLDTFANTYHAWKAELTSNTNVSDFCFSMTERWYQRLFFAHVVSGVTEFDMGIIFRLANDINQRKNRMLLYSYKPVGPPEPVAPTELEFIRQQRVKRFLG